MKGSGSNSTAIRLGGNKRRANIKNGVVMGCRQCSNTTARLHTKTLFVTVVTGFCDVREKDGWPSEKTYPILSLSLGLFHYREKRGFYLQWSVAVREWLSTGVEFDSVAGFLVTRTWPRNSG